MTAIDRSHRTRLILTGLVATLGALIVGIGEFTFQYAPRGGYEATDYLYFLDVDRWRLTFGHFLGVLAAPLYLVGYWHVGQMLRPAGKWLAAGVFGLGVYGFMIGDVWLGGRVNLALIVQARASAPAEVQPLLTDLLTAVSQHNEPLINLVRVLILVLSLLIAWGILCGRSLYPRGAVAVLPIVLLALIFGIYALAPSVGVLLLPAAMNVAHLIFFAVSTWAATRLVPAAT